MIIEREVFLAGQDNLLGGLKLAGGDKDVPPDVEPGSDADIDRDDETPEIEDDEPGSDDKGTDPILPGDGE